MSQKIVSLNEQGRTIRRSAIVDGPQYVGDPATLDEAYELILSVIPTAEIATDNDGQLVIYTNLRLNDDSTLGPFDPDEDREQDSQGDGYAGITNYPTPGDNETPMGGWEPRS